MLLEVARELEHQQEGLGVLLQPLPEPFTREQQEDLRADLDYIGDRELVPGQAEFLREQLRKQ